MIRTKWIRRHTFAQNENKSAIKHNCHLSLSDSRACKSGESAWNFEWHINLLLSHVIDIKKKSKSKSIAKPSKYRSFYTVWFSGILMSRFEMGISQLSHNYLKCGCCMYSSVVDLILFVGVVRQNHEWLIRMLLGATQVESVHILHIPMAMPFTYALHSVFAIKHGQKSLLSGFIVMFG